MDVSRQESPQVKVLYFAQLRQVTQKSEEMVPVESDDSVRSLFYRVAEGYEFPIAFEHLRFAVNEEFVDADARVKSGDTVVFIPPVAGG